MTDPTTIQRWTESLPDENLAEQLLSLVGNVRAFNTADRDALLREAAERIHSRAAPAAHEAGRITRRDGARFNQALGRMPFGGICEFRYVQLGRRTDVELPEIADFVDLVEQNLDRLADVLKRVAETSDGDRRELLRWQRGAETCRDLLAALDARLAPMLDPALAPEPDLEADPEPERASERAMRELAEQKRRESLPIEGEGEA